MQPFRSHVDFRCHGIGDLAVLVRTMMKSHRIRGRLAACPAEGHIGIQHDHRVRKAYHDREPNAPSKSRLITKPCFAAAVLVFAHNPRPAVWTPHPTLNMFKLQRRCGGSKNLRISFPTLVSGLEIHLRHTEPQLIRRSKAVRDAADRGSVAIGKARHARPYKAYENASANGRSGLFISNAATAHAIIENRQVPAGHRRAASGLTTERPRKRAEARKKSRQ
jgi:hypothetical protein